MQSSKDFQALAEELLKDRPDVGKVGRMASRLGLQWQGDLVSLMAQVLEQASRRKARRRKTLEMGT